MARRDVSAVPHSHNGRWQSRSEQVAELHDTKENADAFYRLKAQGQAVADQELLNALAKQAQDDAFLASLILSQQGNTGGDGGAAGSGGSGAGGASGDGGTGDGSGSDGGGSDGGSGDGGSGDAGDF